MSFVLFSQFVCLQAMQLHLLDPWLIHLHVASMYVLSNPTISETITGRGSNEPLAVAVGVHCWEQVGVYFRFRQDWKVK